MLQYLIILLDDTATSFCHYLNPSKKRNLIPQETLKQGIRFAMMENLTIQFVYPEYKLPKGYEKIIDSIDHTKIMPFCAKNDHEADVYVADENNIVEILNVNRCFSTIVLRVSQYFLLNNIESIRHLIHKTDRLNISIVDIDSFNEEDFNQYSSALQILSQELQSQYKSGKTRQLNILTDRLFLTKMNNCGAGDTVVTLAPNGKFYTCPAFYYEDEADNLGNLEQGLNIKNAQLYKIDFAPICRHCDAWHCNRCIWLNKKTTLEVNTPSREQCTVSHIERNASKDLLERLCEQGFKFPNNCIPEIDYSDPFENRELWQQENL